MYPELKPLYRGTTPTYTFKLPDSVDISQASDVYVTFTDTNKKVIFTKSGSDLNIGPHTVSVFLTQEETFSFPDYVLFQLNWIYEEDGETKRACTKEGSIETKPNLLNEVLE